MILPLSAIATHEQAMRILTTAITYQDTLANCYTGSIAFLLKVYLAEVVEGIKISYPQTLPIQNRPLFVWVLFQQVALIEADRSLVFSNGGRQLITCLQALSFPHAPLEFFYVDPDLEIVFKTISSGLKHDDREKN